MANEAHAVLYSRQGKVALELAGEINGSVAAEACYRIELGIEVPERAAITEGGKAEKLGDLKAGDRVRVRWVRTGDGLVADSIAVLGTKAP